MTFKHMKFEDSAVMRSLEKISVEKGLVKEASTKTKSINELVGNKIFASKNLTENIVKLCDHLRTNGFENYASELEYKFLNYKTAATLYETSKETGEDLIDMAHPKGSHKLEGVPGDSVVETVVDKQKAILNVVNKNPTGKLSTAKDIINAVKVVLGEVTLSDEERFSYSKRFLIAAINAFDALKESRNNSIEKNEQIKFSYNKLKEINEKIKNISDILQYENDLKKINEYLYQSQSSILFTSYEDGMSLKKIRDNVYHILATATGKNDSWVKGAFKDSDQSGNSPKPTQQLPHQNNPDQFTEKINNVFDKINKWQPLIRSLSDDKKTKAQNYSNGLSALLNKLKKEFESEKDKSSLTETYIRLLSKKLKDNNYENFSAWVNKEME